MMELLMIHNDPPCRKCRKVEEILSRVSENAGERVTFRSVVVGSPEVEEYGAVMTPMILLDGRVVSAGIVPTEHGIAELVRRELQAGD